MPKTTRAIIRLFYALVTVSVASPSAAESVEISIGVSDKLAPVIVQSLKRQPNACAQDDTFSTDWLRTALEFFIICRAIRIGGVDATYAFQNYPNSARTRVELLRGSFMIMVDLPWGDFALNENLYRSRALLRVGDFVKGIYTRPDHTALLNVKTLEELRNFTAVSSRAWVFDWEALARMKVKTAGVARYVQMGKMVESGRADFLVAEFPGASNLSQYIDGVRFVPVPGVKILLPGSRHVAVSRHFPHSKTVFDALQIGLKIMHDRGLIKKGYRSSGFFNPLIKGWAVLCCE